jgi:hypothetical protein
MVGKDFKKGTTLLKDLFLKWVLNYNLMNSRYVFDFRKIIKIAKN